MDVCGGAQNIPVEYTTYHHIYSHAVIFINIYDNFQQFVSQFQQLLNIQLSQPSDHRAVHAIIQSMLGSF